MSEPYVSLSMAHQMIRDAMKPMQAKIDERDAENAELKRKLSRAERDICEVRAELDATLEYIKTETPGAIKEPVT